jgi:hypothetical protein
MKSEPDLKSISSNSINRHSDEGLSQKQSRSLVVPPLLIEVSHSDNPPRPPSAVHSVSVSPLSRPLFRAAAPIPASLLQLV